MQKSSPGLLLLGLGASALGCAADPQATGPSVQIGVAPLTLSTIDDACYRLTVLNADSETVWQQEGVCSGQYGDGRGAVTYVGPCDAQEVEGVPQVNTVRLELEDLFDANGSVDRDSYRNPCGHDDNGNSDGFGACELSFECLENQDVLVEFNLTVLRNANQGFFDVAVNFEDIFCSAKLDSCDGAGQPIELLHGESGREHTAVAAIACTGGPGAETQLLLAHPYVLCEVQSGGGDVLFDLDLAAATGGNATATGSSGASDYALDYAVYFGNEQLDCGDGENGPVSCGKLFYNIAIDIESLAGQGAPGAGLESCRLFYGATAVTTGSEVFGSTGIVADANGVYPWLSFNDTQGVPLVAAGAPLCFGYGLNSEESLVTTSYILGSAFGESNAADFQVGYRTGGGRATVFVEGQRTLPVPPGYTRANLPIETGGTGATERWKCSKDGDGSCSCSRATSSGGTLTVIGQVVTTWWGGERCEFNKPNVF